MIAVRRLASPYLVDLWGRIVPLSAALAVSAANFMADKMNCSLRNIIALCLFYSIPIWLETL